MTAFPSAASSRTKPLATATITVERPERDEAGQVVLGLKGKGKGKPMPDASLRNTENVSLGEDVEAYFKREVLNVQVVRIHVVLSGSTTAAGAHCRQKSERTPSLRKSTGYGLQCVARPQRPGMLPIGSENTDGNLAMGEDTLSATFSAGD